MENKYIFKLTPGINYYGYKELFFDFEPKDKDAYLKHDYHKYKFVLFEIGENLYLETKFHADNINVSNILLCTRVSKEHEVFDFILQCDYGLIKDKLYKTDKWKSKYAISHTSKVYTGKEDEFTYTDLKETDEYVIECDYENMNTFIQHFYSDTHFEGYEKLKPFDLNLEEVNAIYYALPYTKLLFKYNIIDGKRVFQCLCIGSMDFELGKPFNKEIIIIDKDNGTFCGERNDKKYIGVFINKIFEEDKIYHFLNPVAYEDRSGILRMTFGNPNLRVRAKEIIQEDTSGILKRHIIDFLKGLIFQIDLSKFMGDIETQLDKLTSAIKRISLLEHDSEYDMKDLIDLWDSVKNHLSTSPYDYYY